jgi:hypothetical protein
MTYDCENNRTVSHLFCPSDSAFTSVSKSASFDVDALGWVPENVKTPRDV